MVNELLELRAGGLGKKKIAYVKETSLFLKPLTQSKLNTLFIIFSGS